MATTAERAADEKQKAGSGSLLTVIAAMLVLSIIAAGSGGFLGLRL